MSIRLPRTDEIENTAKLIRSREFLYLTSFADMINRYVEIRFKDKFGFNRLRFATLSSLVTRGGSLTLTKLAQLMFRSKHSITNLIDRLEEDGFVVRERVNKDRRTILATITSAGLEFLARTINGHVEDEEEILTCLDKNEFEMLTSSIRKLRETLIKKLVSNSRRSES